MVAATVPGSMSLRVALLLAAVLAPLAAADLTYSGTNQTEDAHVPQMHCEFVQTEPHGRADPLRCDLEGPLTRATLLRIRLLGPGHVYAFMRDEAKGTQLVQTDCTTTLAAPQRSCLTLLGGNNGLTLPRVALHAFLEGPAPAVATVTVERVQYSLP